MCTYVSMKRGDWMRNIVWLSLVLYELYELNELYELYELYVIAGTSWNDGGYRRDIVGCVRLSFKLRAFSIS